MVYLRNDNGECMDQAVDAYPLPPKDGLYTRVSSVPTWIIPIAVAITRGESIETGVNGIGADENGDLILYRKLDSYDWSRIPALAHVAEVWICIELPISG